MATCRCSVPRNGEQRVPVRPPPPPTRRVPASRT